MKLGVDKTPNSWYNTSTNQEKTKENESMVTDAELIFWLVCGALALAVVVAIPFIDNYLKYLEVRRMFGDGW